MADFGDPMTFLLAQPADQCLQLSTEISQSVDTKCGTNCLEMYSNEFDEPLTFPLVFPKLLIIHHRFCLSNTLVFDQIVEKGHVSMLTHSTCTWQTWLNISILVLSF